MLNYNEIKTRRYIIHEDAPWEVLEHQVSRKQANKPVNKTKLRNLITGQVIAHTFHVSDKVNEADMAKRPVVYLYHDERKGELWFHNEGDKSSRFSVSDELSPSLPKYIRGNDTVTALLFDDQVIGIDLPLKVELKVTDAPPAVKGNTAQGGDKVVTTETGLTVTTPMFINPGDTISISTVDGSYSERVEKQ